MQTVIDELPLLLQGVAVTPQISALVIIAGSLVGIFGGLGLLYGPRWLRALLRGYVDLVRGLPLLVTIFVIFYVPPAFNVEVNGFAAVVVALSIFAGAHISEIVRGAIASVAIEGPFEHMRSQWSFRDRKAGGSTIEFTIDYRLKSRTLQFLMSGMFDMVNRKILSAFESRAEQLYGGRTARSA